MLTILRETIEIFEILVIITNPLTISQAVQMRGLSSRVVAECQGAILGEAIRQTCLWDLLKTAIAMRNISMNSAESSHEE